jgi:hypothetical protein
VGISNTENTKTNMNRDLTSRRRVGNRMFFAYRRMGNSIEFKVSGSYGKGNRLGQFIQTLSLLIFFNLQYFVLVLAATVLLCFVHPALTAGMVFFMRKVPVYQPAHAIMQVYRGPYRGAQVKNGDYGNKELFHITVKVERFSGMVFIKFGKKLTMAC